SRYHQDLHSVPTRRSSDLGVNNDELKEYIEQRRFIDKNISIDELANNYALEHVMQKYNANHGLTFHSRVKLAQEFANRHGQLFRSEEHTSELQSRENLVCR